MNLIVTATTHPEHHENVNQDAVIAKRAKTADGKDAVFAVVCDGMGDKGQSASASVATAFSDWFDAFKEAENADLSPEAVFKSWESVTKKMTKRLFAAFGDDGSCATAALFLMVDGAWFMANVGDVRVYQISSDGAKMLSTDHTYAEREIALGHMDPIEALADPQAFCVLQAIGKTKNVVASRKSGVISKDCVFLICTDGFYRKNLRSNLYRDFRPDSLAEGKEGEALAKSRGNALGGGETDDMSAVVIRYVAEPDEPQDAAREGGEQ